MEKKFVGGSYAKCGVCYIPHQSVEYFSFSKLCKNSDKFTKRLPPKYQQVCNEFL